MAAKTVKLLRNETKDEFKKWIDSFDTVLMDCDGVLWLHTFLIDGSKEALCLLRQLGKEVFLVTNNAAQTRAEICQKIASFGFDVDESHIICPAHSIANYLQRQHVLKAYIIGDRAIGEELSKAGVAHTGIGPDIMGPSLYAMLSAPLPLDDQVTAVIVAFDKHFSLPKLLKATAYLERPGCHFLVTNTDAKSKLPGGVWMPEAGPIVAAVKAAAGEGFVYTLLGKPDVALGELLIKEHGLVAERTLMMGDRCDTDVLFGLRCGFQTLLVGTGCHSMEDVCRLGRTKCELIPDAFVERLGEIVEIFHNHILQCDRPTRT